MYTNTIAWRNPIKELPEEGQLVWVLMQHWKKEGALSCEIYCGEVQISNDGKHIRAFNNDYIGSGGANWTIWEAEDFDYPSDEVAVAWIPAEELPLPRWL